MNSVPPPPGRTPEVSFPAIPQIVLKNGLTVVCVEDHHLPRVSVRLALPLGRVADTDELQGLTQMVIEMLKEGTASRTSQDIAEALDQMAIDFECDVSMEHSVIAMTMLSGQLGSGLELLVDLLRNPSFPQVELEKVRTRWRGNLLAQRADPGFLANERMFKEVYDGHPYSKTSVPIEHLDLFTCEMLRHFFQENLTPKGAYLLLAGAIEMEEAVEVAERYFGDWVGTEPISVQFPELRPIEDRIFALVDRPHSAQTKILTGVRTVRQSDPSVVVLKLANQILGGSASARLFLNLREDKGYTYGAYSFQKSYREDGMILASANVRTDATRNSIEEIFSESERMRKTLAREDEISRSKAEIIGSFLRQMETPGSIGSLEILRFLMELPDDYYTSYVPTIRSLEPEDVRAVSEQYLDSARMLTTLVGDRGLLEGQFQEMGELRIYDVDGNRLK